MNIKNLLALAVVSVVLGCGTAEKDDNAGSQIDAVEMERVNTWFDTVFERDLLDSPEFMSNLGRKDRQRELDDISEAHSLEQLEQAKQDLAELQGFEVS